MTTNTSTINAKQYAKLFTQPNYGFTLLEVLITMSILAFGMLGIAKLQLNSLRDTQIAQFQTKANLLVQKMSAHIEANSTVLANYQLNFKQLPSASIDCQVSSCSPNEIAQYDLLQWQNLISASLPAGSGEILINNNRATIIVHWDENRDGSAGNNCPKQTSADLECVKINRQF
ncbi:type IV pilus modification protein PilV [Thalassomonas sp. M1454]|uniref:type IV pilus modification protein PilV n=1 Tax=Thalassomonas sp. M1454 TaxID=2594477 RepID=UPI00117C6E6A|nr:type IV pilus modification protein PilV [Thalassomonas sp. M1454]TRX54418.1 type IV pilus modification protein PilV [Thalassomonas sp. M1454]